MTLPKTFCRSFCFMLAVIGGTLIMSVDATASPVFKLRHPEYYFKDKTSLALLSSAMSGSMTYARGLVQKGANPNDEGPLDNKYNRLRLLHYAIAANKKEAVNVLINVGADPELDVRGFGRAFLFAMTLQNHEMLSLLLNIRPVNTLSMDTLEYALFGAVTQGCTYCLSLFLDHGAPIDFRDGAGSTVMMAAMDTEDYDMAEWLLQRGASVHVVAGGGVTPAYSVEYHLKKYREGSPTYKKVLHLKEMMKERGAVFPALSPAEVRAKHGK